MRRAIDGAIGGAIGGAMLGARDRIVDRGAGLRVTRMSNLDAVDLHLFSEGRARRAYRVLGCHLDVLNGVSGAWFSVWAPSAQSVSVIGSFNDWNTSRHVMRSLGDSGIWNLFIANVGVGDLYKFRIRSADGYTVEKADPFAFCSENPPQTASVVWDLSYQWNDHEWMQERARKQRFDAPISIYEVHLGSWRRHIDEPESGAQPRPLSYRELAESLPSYVREMGFTHVELMPVMEHPFYGSWGYQTTSYFAPTSRYGTPQDFMHLIDCLHQAGIGVVLDWVPSHFPSDAHGLGFFDGSHLFEHADPRQGFHPDWRSLIFNYGRREVASFLLSSAMAWLDLYHADALRVDAVASMLYLDYSRNEGEWVANRFGGRENIEAVEFIRHFNEAVYSEYPDVHVIAEESTAWPRVSAPTDVGGLGFGMKWDMGWMHDTLKYFSRDPIYRRFHHDELTFRMMYAFNENFVLALSHDEVVHGKGSLLSRMPGDEWRKFANLRALYAYMFALPGKKLLFMGSEIAPWAEWSHEQSLDWHLLNPEFSFGRHFGMQNLVRDLNFLMRSHAALHECDFSSQGFEWIEANDAPSGILSFIRKGRSDNERVIFALNLTPVVRHDYQLGLSRSGAWRELLTTDAKDYGGEGIGNGQGILQTGLSANSNGRHELRLTLPPLGAVFLKSVSLESG